MDEVDTLIEELRADYLDVRRLPDGSVALLERLLTTTAVLLGVNRWGWERRFCFTSPTLARKVFNELQSEDDEPTGWVARRPER